MFKNKLIKIKDKLFFWIIFLYLITGPIIFYTVFGYSNPSSMHLGEFLLFLLIVPSLLPFLFFRTFFFFFDWLTDDYYYLVILHIIINIIILIFFLNPRKYFKKAYAIFIALLLFFILLADIFCYARFKDIRDIKTKTSFAYDYLKPFYVYLSDNYFMKDKEVYLKVSYLNYSWSNNILYNIVIYKDNYAINRKGKMILLTESQVREIKDIFDRNNWKSIFVPFSDMPICQESDRIIFYYINGKSSNISTCYYGPKHIPQDFINIESEILKLPDYFK